MLCRVLGSLDLGVLGIILESGTGMLYGTGSGSYIVQCSVKILINGKMVFGKS